METAIGKYYDNLQKPWSRLFYEIITMQLDFAKNLRILDFGSGFGVLACALAANNEVVAIEPNKDMVQKRY